MKYAIDKIKKQIISLTAEAVGAEIDRSRLEVVVPPDAQMGDLAVSCFYLSKVLRRSPNQIADDLRQKIRPGGVVKSVQNIGPYLNFFLNPKELGRQVIGEIKAKGDDYGRLKLSKEKVMIEYSQPNTHKEFHVGHCRNAILGNALVNLVSFAGYKTVPVNYIGDIGSHVAKCLWALKKFHAKDQTPENKASYLGKIYTEAVQKIEANPLYKQESAEVQQKLENGDRSWLALWKKTRQWSLDGFDRIYKILGSRFDHVFYESEVEKPGKKIVEQMLKDGLAEKSQGATIINLQKYGLKDFLLLKSDGSSLYSTKDLALAQLKFKKFKIDRSVVVTDSRQDFYFQQLFKTLELIGFDKPMTHVSYEFVTLADGAMSSREGNVVLFEDFFNQVAETATLETKTRHADWPEKKIQKTAVKIALSAIKFNMLKVYNNSIIVFDIKEALSFDGFSGPYIQYMASRINSLLKKAKSSAGYPDFSQLQTEIEKEMLLKLAEFPEVIKNSVDDFSPAQLARYLFDLSKLFANFYQTVPILNSPKEVRIARLALVSAVRQVFANGLGLLGIDLLNQM